MRESRSALRAAIGALLVALACSPAHSADFFHFQATALKSPDCITDAAPSFFSQNVQLAEPPHPTLPIGRYYMIVRYLGANSVSFPTVSDYGRFPSSYSWPPFSGLALTGLTVPEPKNAWQRARHPGATPDDSSAFQLHCHDAGLFMNTWTFLTDPAITGGGPHAIYGYSFDDVTPPPIFDANPATDFVLQASLEIPWFAAWPHPGASSGVVPIGQVSFFAYLRDRQTGKTFALLLAIYDNRFAANPTYPSFVAHDGATPFVSMPLSASARYARVPPFSATFTGTTWSGLRFFRAHITQDAFRQALADVNAYCVANRTQRYCGSAPGSGSAFSSAPTDYQITDFGIIHELGLDPGDNLSMGLHIFDLGAWNFR